MPAVAAVPVMSRVAPKGYTLLEMLVVIAIVAIVSAIAMPQFTRLIELWRIASNLETLSTSIDFARAEALGRNTIVQICRTGDPWAATPACSNSTVDSIGAQDWATGWIVYARPQDSVGLAPFAAGVDTLLQRYEPQGRQGGTRRALVTTDAGESSMGFSGSGFRIEGEGNARVFTLDYRAPTAAAGRDARCISVSVIGKVRTGIPTSTGGCDVS